MRLIDKIVVPVMLQVARLQPLDDLRTEIEFHSNPAPATTLADGVGRAAATEWVQDEFAGVCRHFNDPIQNLGG